MSESSSDEENSEWVFYRDRPEWQDIKPISQDDKSHLPIVPIAYTERFSDVYGYFWAVLAKCEWSERALNLCTDALSLNPANYTVWHFRRDILRHLQLDLRPELQYIGEMIEQFPKNYQVWNHRQIIVEWLNDGSEELQLTASLLSKDSKNYHAWQHRQWAVSKFNLHEGELDFIDELLKQDIRNNSAWNNRFYIINNTTEFTPEVVESEINYALEAISFAPSNESPWNYLRGILAFSEKGLVTPKVIDACESLYEDKLNCSVHLLSFMMDSALEKFKISQEKDADSLKRALKLLDELANRYDKIRATYWRMIAEQVKQQCEKVTQNDSSAEALST